jgi:hypothetical protein
MVTIRTLIGPLWMFGIVLLFPPGLPMNAETPSSTGIEGTVSAGPTHGGPVRAGEPDSAPLANRTCLVETAAGTIKTFTTDDKGHFKVELPPGRYAIRVEKIGIRNRGCTLADIEVTSSGFKQIELKCDTGMR